MTNQKIKTKYDLEERTSVFAENVVSFLSKLDKTIVNKSLIQQAVKSATSVGANYMEADAAQSKRDFEHKLSICRKEAKETMYWMRILSTANPNKTKALRVFYKEAEEFVKIFSAIINNSRNNPLV